uniref:Aquaporin n=1 Tax=Attheya septentrionalis TaxID=420275 RepID=A0A7S2U7D9_9STRA|mmetsp:Transcript_11268/g.20518  ORF Transcript_11268/g.20518 Transcript_11268/m.20518 type:complete len:273 (+) Transcript_11268:140-958(+)|eukprot:CAMPEP_0198284078 /NCGR_PEP_ID=MMETSP1449-20131203/3600_1 /TAXON_ID=420275 /ORGANISM="Attheya septentrionalis, Strain CCMP2084" /LENGTH=272 /DNA_ID=CAMNT_0043980993 /DNA_START=81 /DNA_END=899 /DNA_ORIENTATION=-
MTTQYGSLPTSTSTSTGPPETFGLKKQCIAEFIGTATLVQVGCGGLCAGLYMGSLDGLWQAAIVWIIGATLAIYATAHISGAHLNPAVSLAFCIVRPDDFPWSKMLFYWVAQMLGAMMAGLMNLILFSAAISSYETSNGLSRGEAKAIHSAGAFGDYWSLSKGVSGPFHALFIEAFGTAFLTFVIFSVTNPKNKVPSAAVAPLVGCAIGMMIVTLGSLTGAGINPARDLGPRLVTVFSGWGMAAMKDFPVYIAGPLIGGPIGAILADFVLFA